METFDMKTVATALVFLIMVIGCAVSIVLDRHPRLKSALSRIVGMIGVLAFLAIPGLGWLLGLVLGLVLVIPRIPAMNRRNKAATDAYLARRRQDLADDMERWRRNKDLEQLRRSSARTQVEEMEKKARHWEYQAGKTRTYSDIRQAKYYRDLANAARKRVY